MEPKETPLPTDDGEHTLQRRRIRGHVLEGTEEPFKGSRVKAWRKSIAVEEFGLVSIPHNEAHPVFARAVGGTGVGDERRRIPFDVPRARECV